MVMFYRFVYLKLWLIGLDGVNGVCVVSYVMVDYLIKSGDVMVILIVQDWMLDIDIVI